MSQLKKGAALSYLTIILTNAVGLVLTPFIIRYLGNSEYGLYTLIGSLIGYISVLDLGLNNTIIRFVSKYRAQQDKRSEQNFLATVMIIYGVIALAISVIGVGLYFNLDNFFDKLTPEQLVKAKIMFGILIFNLAITLPGGAFTAICSAYEHFVFPRAANIVKYIARSAMVVGLLILGGDSVALVVLDTIVNLVAIGVNIYYVFKILNVRFQLRHFEKSLVREIFKYSVWIFVFAMVGQFQWQSGQIILGKISGPIAVGIYGVGILLGTYYGAFSTAISGVFLPRATKMTVLEASGSELTDMMTRIGRFSLIALLLIFGGFLIFGQQFVALWVGEHYLEAWTVAIIIMFSYTLPLVQSFANSILEARGLFAFKAVTYISLIVIGTGIGAYLVRFYGISGIIYGSAGGWILSQIFVNIYYRRKLKLEILRFFKELSRGLLPTFLVILAIGYGIDQLPGNGWINLVFKIGTFGAVYALLMFRFGINSGEKQIFTDAIPFLRKTRHA